MTTKEIAEAVGKDERTIQRWAKSTGDKMASIGDKVSAIQNKGIAADYDFDETVAIIEHGLGKNAADLYRMSAKQDTQTFPREVENSSIALASAFNMMASAFDRMTLIVQNQGQRLQSIEKKLEERKALLPAPQIEPREHINMIVRDYSSKTGIEFREVWKELYKQFSYRTNSNPSISAKNRGMTIIDYIESEGMIETLESIAIDCLK